jgi:hypothetical protein
VQPRDRFRLAGGIATHHHQSSNLILTSELADHLPTLGVGFVRDRASVDYAKIGALIPDGFPVAIGLEKLLRVLRFILIDLAAQRDQAAGSRLIH